MKRQVAERSSGPIRWSFLGLNGLHKNAQEQTDKAKREYFEHLSSTYLDSITLRDVEF